MKTSVRMRPALAAVVVLLTPCCSTDAQLGQAHDPSSGNGGSSTLDGGSGAARGDDGGGITGSGGAPNEGSGGAGNGGAVARGGAGNGGANTASGGTSGAGNAAGSGGECACTAIGCGLGTHSVMVPGQCCPSCEPCGTVNCPNIPACPSGKQPVTLPGQCCPSSCGPSTQVACNDGTGLTDCCPPEAAPRTACEVDGATCWSPCTKGIRVQRLCNLATWYSANDVRLCESDGGLVMPAHCGGNTTHPPTCSAGYECVGVPESTLPAGDVGGICVPKN
jgi:hypothetical protein